MSWLWDSDAQFGIRKREDKEKRGAGLLDIVSGYCMVYTAAMTVTLTPTIQNNTLVASRAPEPLSCQNKNSQQITSGNPRRWLILFILHLSLSSGLTLVP